MKLLIAHLLVVLTFGGLAQIDLTSDLILCLPMNGNANDYSGNNNNGVLSGVTPTVNRFGVANSAYHFDGVSNYISVPSSNSINNIETNDELSITAWCKPLAWYPTWNIFGIVEKYNPSSDWGWAFALQNANGNGAGNDAIFINNYPAYFETNLSVTLGQWAFYALTYSKSNQTMKFYKNGNLIQTFNNSGLALENTGSGSVYIGFSPVGIDEYSNGDIDDLRLYNRALTDQEINALFLQPYSCAGELIPVASFSITQNPICVNAPVFFTDQSTNNPTSWNWQITGGASTSFTTSNPSYSFPSPGIYTITLTSSNGAGSSNTSVQTLTINNCLFAPVATFSVSRKQICAGQSISFTDQSSNTPNTWSWQIQGGFPSTSSISSPTVNFPNPGVYTVSLIAGNSVGQSNAAIQTITVSSCVSLTELNESTTSISVYPNPTYRFVNITGVSRNSVLVFNAIGEQITVEQNNLRQELIEFDFRPHAPGLYFLRIVDKNEKPIKTFKVMILSN